LFPVQYDQAFYEKLFKEGFFTVAVWTEDNELIGVATARIKVPEQRSWWNFWSSDPKEGCILEINFGSSS
jgi:hypothetical protein